MSFQARSLEQRSLGGGCRWAAGYRDGGLACRPRSLDCTALVECSTSLVVPLGKDSCLFETTSLLKIKRDSS